MNLLEPVDRLVGVGIKTALALNQLAIFRMQDFLFHLPFRYQNKTRIVTLDHIIIGQETLLEVRITKTEQTFSRRKMFICHATDTSGRLLTIRFFNISQGQQQMLNYGATVQCFGEVKLGQHGLEMPHPEYRVISQRQKPLLESSFSPVYHTTHGIHQNQLRKWVDIALASLKSIPCVDATSLCCKDNAWPLTKSIDFLHHPDANADIKTIALYRHPAQRSLIFEEFCAHRLSLIAVKKKT